MMTTNEFIQFMNDNSDLLDYFEETRGDRDVKSYIDGYGDDVIYGLLDEMCNEFGKMSIDEVVEVYIHSSEFQENWKEWANGKDIKEYLTERDSAVIANQIALSIGQLHPKIVFKR